MHKRRNTYQVTDNKGITLSSLKIDDVKTKGEGLANGSKVGLIYMCAYVNGFDIRPELFKYYTHKYSLSENAWIPNTEQDIISLMPDEQGPITGRYLVGYTPSNFLDNYKTAISQSTQFITLNSPGYFKESDGLWNNNKSDFCVGLTELTAPYKNVSITMKHLFSMVNLIITKDDDFITNTGKIERIELSGYGLKSEKQFSLYFFNWANYNANDDGSKSLNNIQFDLSENNINLSSLTSPSITLSIPFLVVPSFFESGTSILIRIHIDGAEYAASYITNPTNGTSWTNGVKNNIELRLSKSGLAVNKVTLSNWSTSEIGTIESPLIPNLVED